MWLPSITQNKRILAAGFAFFLGLVAIGTIGMSPNILSIVLMDGSIYFKYCSLTKINNANTF